MYMESPITESDEVLTFPGTNFKYRKCNKTLASCLDTLGQNLRADFRKSIEEVITQMHNLGFALGILHSAKAGYRTFQEQCDVSTNATKAGPGESFHNYGLAVDLGFLEWIDKDGNPHINDFWLGGMDKMADYKGFSKKLWEKRNSIRTDIYTLNSEIIHMQGVGAAKSGRNALVITLNEASINQWKYRRSKTEREKYECNFGNEGDWKIIGTARQVWNQQAENSTPEQKSKLREDMTAAESMALTIDLSGI